MLKKKAKQDYTESAALNNERCLDENGITQVDGILLDLGHPHTSRKGDRDPDNIDAVLQDGQEPGIDGGNNCKRV